MRSANLVVCALLLSCAAVAEVGAEQTYRSVEQKVTFIAPAGWSIFEADQVLGEKNKVLFSAKDTANPQRMISLAWQNETKNGFGNFVSAYQIMRTIDSATFGGEPLSTKITTIFIGGIEFAQADFKLKAPSIGFLKILTGNVRGNIFKFSLNSDHQEDLDELTGLVAKNTLFDPDWAASWADQFPWNTSKRVQLELKAFDALRIKSRQPDYPPLAKQSRIQGWVAFRGVIGIDGRVKYLWLRMGDPTLVPNSIDAIKKWTYKPYILNGKAVELEEDFAVNYALL